MSFDFKKYREENKEKNREYQKRYYLEHRQEFLDRSKKYRETHNKTEQEYRKYALLISA